VPPEIVDLRSLTTFDLSDNPISALPEKLNGLHLLDNLMLSKKNLPLRERTRALKLFPTATIVWK